MEEMRLPQYVGNRIERRCAARFARMLGSWRRLERATSPSDRSCDPLRSSQVKRLLKGSPRPPTVDGNMTLSRAEAQLRVPFQRA
jgi:hypothetical protein